MKLTKRDLLKLYNGIIAMEGRAYSVKFSYFIAKNKVALRDEISALEEARKPSDEYRSFDTKRAKLAQKYADKNEDGSAKIHENSFVITKNVDKFQSEIKKLREKNKKYITEFEKQMVDFEELLDTEATLENTSKIVFKDIPQSIEPSILEVLILADLIIED